MIRIVEFLRRTAEFTATKSHLAASRGLGNR